MHRANRASFSCSCRLHKRGHLSTVLQDCTVLHCIAIPIRLSLDHDGMITSSSAAIQYRAFFTMVSTLPICVIAWNWMKLMCFHKRTTETQVCGRSTSTCWFATFGSPNCSPWWGRAKVRIEVILWTHVNPNDYWRDSGWIIVVSCAWPRHSWFVLNDAPMSLEDAFRQATFGVCCGHSQLLYPIFVVYGCLWFIIPSIPSIPTIPTRDWWTCEFQIFHRLRVVGVLLDASRRGIAKRLPTGWFPRVFDFAKGPTLLFQWLLVQYTLWRLGLYGNHQACGAELLKQLQQCRDWAAVTSSLPTGCFQDWSEALNTCRHAIKDAIKEVRCTKCKSCIPALKLAEESSMDHSAGAQKWVFNVHYWQPIGIGLSRSWGSKFDQNAKTCLHRVTFKVFPPSHTWMRTKRPLNLFGKLKVVEPVLQHSMVFHGIPWHRSCSGSRAQKSWTKSSGPAEWVIWSSSSTSVNLQEHDTAFKHVYIKPVKPM